MKRRKNFTPEKIFKFLKSQKPDYTFGYCIYLFEAVSIGTSDLNSDVEVEIGGGGGGGNVGGGVTFKLKSSEAEKSHNLDNPLAFLAEAGSEADVVLVGNFLLRFLADLE